MATFDRNVKEHWEEHAEFGIDLFKQENRFFQHEKSHQDLVKQQLSITFISPNNRLFTK